MKITTSISTIITPISPFIYPNCRWLQTAKLQRLSGDALPSAIVCLSYLVTPQPWFLPSQDPSCTLWTPCPPRPPCSPCPPLNYLISTCLKYLLDHRPHHNIVVGTRISLLAHAGHHHYTGHQARGGVAGIIEAWDGDWLRNTHGPTNRGPKA